MTALKNTIRPLQQETIITSGIVAMSFLAAKAKMETRSGQDLTHLLFLEASLLLFAKPENVSLAWPHGGIA